MQSFCLQDYLTIRGQLATTVVTQGDYAWLDLSGFQDAVFWLDVREASAGTASVTIAFQTCADERRSTICEHVDVAD